MADPIALTFQARDLAHARRILEAVEGVEAGPASEHADARGGADSGGTNPARRARLHAMLAEAGTAIDEGDEDGARRVLAALDAALALSPPSAAGGARGVG